MKKIFTLLMTLACVMSYAQTEISDMVAGVTTLNLTAGTEYTLNAEAVLGVDVLTINGNGATITVGEAGKFSIQKGIVLNNVILDASGSSKSALELSSTPDSSLATYTKEGETVVMKYPNATLKCFEAEKIVLSGCTYITNNSVFRPAAAWSIRTLTIENTIIEVKYKIGKSIINMEENGAGLIQNINIKNSTIYADDPAIETRFLRYCAQYEPWRVWGYEGEMTSTKNYWNIEHSTLVGVCGNKEFINNIKNSANTELTLKNNAFINTWRVCKLGTSCVRNFVQADNVTMGGYNSTDATDATWFTYVADLGATWNFGEGEGQIAAPSALDVDAMRACFTLAEDYKTYGDPRWVSSPTAVQNTTSTVKAQKLIENGQVVIIRDGKKFNALGAQL